MPKHIQQQTSSQSRYYFGILALFLVVIIWVASSFLMKNIFSDKDYNKPFFVTYVNTASFSLYLVIISISQRDKLPREISNLFRAQGEYSYLNNADPETIVDQNSVVRQRSLNTIARDPGSHEEDLTILEPTLPSRRKMTVRETARLAFTFCILWFLANWSTNASLAYTSVASSTILSSMSGLFTLGIGALAGVELFNLLKLAAVCISIVGVILVSTSDLSTPNPLSFVTSSPLFGDFLALAGAFFYGLYTTTLKLRIGHESRLSMPLFFGFVGVFNIAFLWPGFMILDWLNIEKFELPLGENLWVMVLANAIVGTFLSDYLWLLAMLMTSPLVVTLGLSLTIPFALIGDVIFKHLSVKAQYWLGAILVITGFLTINVVEMREKKVEKDQLDDRNGESAIDSNNTGS